MKQKHNLEVQEIDNEIKFKKELPVRIQNEKFDNMVLRGTDLDTQNIENVLTIKSNSSNAKQIEIDTKSDQKVLHLEVKNEKFEGLINDRMKLDNQMGANDYKNSKFESILPLQNSDFDKKIDFGTSQSSSNYVLIKVSEIENKSFTKKLDAKSRK